MRDELFDRDYQAGRAAFHDGIARGLARIATTFGTGLTALNRRQFAAPWRPRERVGCKR